MLYFCSIKINQLLTIKKKVMSKKTNSVAALETAKSTSIRIKENYRFTGLSSRSAIITETDKSISSAIRSGIKSLLIDLMSDSNVDLITISFLYSDTGSDSILDSRCDKFTITRNGDFVTIPIDNFLLDWLKVNSLEKIILRVFSTDLDTFDANCVSKQYIFAEKWEYEYKLLEIYKAFVYELC